MSVVVRMEMPANCDKCDLRNGCKLYVDYSWSLSDCFPTRPKPNPLDKGCHILTVLPEGHGRLVDASTRIYIMNVPITVDDASHIVHALPTIVPADTAERSE